MYDTDLREARENGMLIKGKLCKVGDLVNLSNNDITLYCQVNRFSRFQKNGISNVVPRLELLKIEGEFKGKFGYINALEAGDVWPLEELELLLAS